MFRVSGCPFSNFLPKARGLGWLGVATLSAAVACGTGKPFSSTTVDGTAGDAALPVGGDGSGGKDSSAASGSDSGGSINQSGTGGRGDTAGTGGSAAEGGMVSDFGGQTSSDGGADPGQSTCAETCVDPTPYCADVNGTPTCTNPAQALSGKRLELACVTGADAVSELCESVADRATKCPKGGKVDKQVIRISGDPSALYSVTLHVRGVVEPRTYVGGKDAGNHFYVGGTGQQPSNYNTFSIAVSSPAQTFYLNADTKPESYRVFTLDHEESIVVAGGASVTLQVLDPDCAMVKNCKTAGAATCAPYVVEGVPPAPKAFNANSSSWTWSV